MMKNAILILLALTLFLAVSASAEDESSLLGKPFQDFTVTDIDGNTFTLSEALKDHEAVLINFWATWCGPCRSEFPAINKVYEEYKDKGFIILGVYYTEDGVEDVVKNHTVSLSNDTLLSYRVLFNSGYAAKTVRLDFSGISPDSPSLLLQFTRVSDRLSIEPFFSNTFDFVTYQPDLEDNPSLFQTASPDLVIQFIYEDELSLLLQ